jgi:hypothetical protein
VRARWGRPECWVFAILLASYAFFWHSRDWNTASRLMLTYAIVDRGTVCITGLDRQTGDKAWFQGQFYSDKLPGLSLLATVPYAVARWVFGLPAHPLDVKAKDYWAADYWVTLGTSGVLTAATAVLLVRGARALGCGPRRAALIGLAYGLATPAYAYATLAYGHQAAAFALFASFFLLWRPAVQGRHESFRMLLAGFLAAYAAVIELQVGPVSAILGLYLLVECATGSRRPDAVGLFAVGALVPTLILLAYNQLAFGSPWDMGYFHHATDIFAKVHNRDNPLGLAIPKHPWTRLAALLWGRYRGLAFYAPILLLAVPGWVVLLLRRAWGLVIVSFLVTATVVLVNVCYPEWTGGWSTGPRLLTPLLPFAMLPVAALLAGNSRWARVATWAALVLALAGGVEMLLFQCAGARIPVDVPDPLVDAVWPLWRGKLSDPFWWPGGHFCCNAVSLCAPGWVARLDPAWQALQFLPLVAAQALAILGLYRFAGDHPARMLKAV